MKILRSPAGPRIVLAALALTALASSPAAESPRSEWVYPGPNGKLIYKTTPAGDRIMDFSYAGYMGGGVALPNVPVKKTVKPSGQADDTALIQAAIDEVSALPVKDGFRGAVLLEPGTYPCARAITISTSGVVLRGSGSAPGEKRSTIRMTGGRHGALAIRGSAGGRRGESQGGTGDDTSAVQTSIADAYVPSGAISFTVADAKGFAAGDIISIRRPVTEAWVKFMQMDDLTRNGRPQTWIRAGTTIPKERRIAAIAGNRITLDVPLSDSFDSKYLNPPGTSVVKINPPARVTQCGIENLHIECPPQEVNHSEQLYSAMRVSGEDCWVRDVVVDETMNSIGIGGRRITLQRVSITRKADHVGASKPAEFAPNGDQILLDRCSVNADNVWFSATGAGNAGPIVLLNCTFTGTGRIEGHQRWTTGMLMDNCRLAGGGIDFKNRGSMGSGHGWGTGWSVAWNCVARNYVIQQPPGAFNWAIGCIGDSTPMSRPFSSSPMLAEGTFESRGKPVGPQSLYLAQLRERLGPQALKNIGYPESGELPAADAGIQPATQRRAEVHPVLGEDFALRQPVNARPVREPRREFAAAYAVDGNEKTFWSTPDGTTNASLEVDMDGPTEINTVVLCEPASHAGRVQEYRVEGQVDSDWKLLCSGKTIGGRKVDRFPKVVVWKVRLLVQSAGEAPGIQEFSLHQDRTVERLAR